MVYIKNVFTREQVQERQHLLVPLSRMAAEAAELALWSRYPAAPQMSAELVAPTRVIVLI